METCSIHKEKEYNYGFISTQEQLEELVEALTTKGARENSLKETLINEMIYLKGVIKKTPVTKLNRNKTEATKRKYLSDSIKPSNVAGLTPSVALDLTFRELLLDLEDKSVQGSLGGFKEPDLRKTWRADLEKPLLEMQNWEPEKTNEEFQEIMETDEEIGTMASKLLEFADTIPVKFLKAPLGEQGTSLRNKLENWRASLPNCRNFSQLFLYYSSLEASIEWQKGLTNARCKVCRGKATPDRMVRCEQCDLVFHLSCVKPALREVPEKEWFCKFCEPDTLPESPRKKFVARSDANGELLDEPESNDYCEVCLKDEKLINCDVCPRSFHLDCIQLKRAPRGDWCCLACTLGIKKYKKELKDLRKIIEERDAFEDSVLDDSQINQCLKCGELLSRGHIVCVGCGRKYHLACADLTKRPKGDWYCKKRCEPGYVPIKAEEDQSDAEQEAVEPMDTEQTTSEDVDVDGFDYKACCDILDVLKKSDHAWPFIHPVSKKDAPGYFKIIKKPMDLSLVESKLKDMKYPTNATFVEDVLQIFINCETYNLKEAEVYKEGRRLLDIFIGLMDNYSLSSLLDATKFSWLEEAVRSRCTRCQLEFASGLKRVCCRFCTATLHLKCAGLRITVDKWTCDKCAEKNTDETNDNDVDDVAPVEQLDKNSFDYKECTDLVEFLIKDNLSFPFRKPVSKKEAPDYEEIIENPMDLSTIQTSLNSMDYKKNKDVIDDIVLMFDNCERYNDEKSEIYHGAAKFWNIALKKINELGLSSAVDRSKVPKWRPSRTSMNRRSLF